MIYRGTYFTYTFAFEDADGAPLNITGWTFAASIKGQDGAEDIAATTASGHFTVSSAEDGEMTFALTSVQTAALTDTDLIKFDLTRTDASPGPVWLLRAEFDITDLGE
jgi:hypothetical protein